jgi:sugar (pentulose or hexulose) kinase
MSPLAALAVARNNPRAFNEGALFPQLHGYITARMTGWLTCDFTQAYAYHFFDMRRGCWDAPGRRAAWGFH